MPSRTWCAVAALPSNRVADDFAGHAFADQALLAQALTHRSAGSPHNERLEFLGDALVNQFVAEALYLRWPKADEGALTRARSVAPPVASSGSDCCEI